MRGFPTMIHITYKEFVCVNSAIKSARTVTQHMQIQKHPKYDLYIMAYKPLFAVTEDYRFGKTNILKSDTPEWAYSIIYEKMYLITFSLLTFCIIETIFSGLNL